MGLLREMSHSTSEVGNEYDDPGISYHNTKHRSYQRLQELAQKHSEVNTKSLPLAKSGTISSSISLKYQWIKAHQVCLTL